MIRTGTTWKVAAAIAMIAAATSSMFAQGITTGAIAGKVIGAKGEEIAGANVVAVHIASNTTYGTSSRENGRFVIPNVRVGGPYTVTVSIIGYKKVAVEKVFTIVSQTTEVDFTLTEEAVQTSEIVTTGERQSVLNPSRTGAATNIDKVTFGLLPTISGKFQDFVRLTPESRSNTSYGGDSYIGQDSRYNNTTVDGAYFNNSFGLMGQVGERTGVAPISLDAIEQVQVNIAPFDVRQGNFVGAAMNAVTKSGTNNWTGTLMYDKRNQDMVGTRAYDYTYNPGTFDYNKFTFSLGGPIIKDKLFFFVNYEGDKTQQPGTVYTANTGTQAATGNVTRVLASDLDALSTFLTTKFGYNPGPYQGYNFNTPGKRYLAKLDFNLDESNKISVRYNRLDSQTDVLVSNSNSLGFGNRRGTNFGLNFAGSNYTIDENDYSFVGEWNSIVSSAMYNNLIVGYSYSDESRGDPGQLFPFVDILNAGAVYTSFGTEPFTPNNELRYSSWQLQDNFTWDLGTGHVLTFGVTGEKYHSENVFFPGKQSVYVYNSLSDFYTDANAYLNHTSSPVAPREFQVRYNNIPGQVKPIQPLDVYTEGAYAQDEYQVTRDLKVTGGIRFDIPSFGNTGFDNPNADALTFMDENGNPVHYNSAKLPSAKLLLSPRLGFNYDVFGDRTTQVRGGTGIFTGKPAYVWISNQIGNTGVLTGFLQVTDTTQLKNYHFNPNPDAYKPTNVTGAPASTYELALTDPNYKFPQQWRSDIAVDQQLPFGFIGTGEFIYGREINGEYYINANQTAPNSSFSGPDDRPRWVTVTPGVNPTRINQNVQDATVIKNESNGYNWSVAASIERPLLAGIYGKVGYNYAVAKNTVDPGSIAFGSWSANQVPGNPNNAPVAYSQTSPGSRVFASASYTSDGGTTLTLFWDSYSYGNGSYTVSGDLNGDGNSSNDLIYIPRNQSEMNFVQNTQSGVTVTPAQQAAAWDAYINQDPYLSKHRGQYAERDGAFLPMVSRLDMSIIQAIKWVSLEKPQTIELRLDILNVGNLFDRKIGQGSHFVSLQPLILPTAAEGGPVNAAGQPQYKMRVVNGALMSHTFEYNSTLSDVYSIQFGVKYYF